MEESDVALDVRQKGVDMKIGLDIAALAFKKALLYFAYPVKSALQNDESPH